MVKNSKFTDNVQVWYSTTKRYFINTNKKKKELENERYFLHLVDISLSITTQLIIEMEHQIKSKREWNYQWLD